MDWVGVSIPFVATMCYATLTGLVLIQGRGSRPVRAFAALLVAHTIWTSGSLAWHLTAGLFWNRVLVTGITLGLLGLVYFIHVFLNLKKRIAIYVVLAAVVLLIAMTWTGYVITDSYMKDGTARMELGPGFGFLMVTGAVTYGWAVVQLLKYYRIQGDHTFRYKIQYLVLGLAIHYLAGLTNAIPGVGHYPIDVAFGAITATLIAYAILRHQLLDIRVVIRRGLAYSILTASVVTAYLLSVFLIERVFRLFLGPGAYIGAALMAIVFAVLYDPLRQATQSWVDRVFFRERYDVQRMIEEISRATASILSSDTLGSFVLDKIAASMSISRALLFVANPKDGVLRCLAQRGYPDDEIPSLIPGHPVVTWLRELDHSLRRDEWQDLPRFRGLWAQERRDLEYLDVELFIPIRFEGVLIGILAVGPKLSEVPYSSDDEAAFRTLTNQLAVAIVNARLVTDLQRSLAELRQTQNQLVEAAKLSAVGQLVAGVAHELNNPLTTIKGYSQLLGRTELPLSSKQDLGRIDEAAERCRRIVQNLLTFARRHESEKAMCNISEILEKTLLLQEYRFRVNNIQLVKDLQTEVPDTLADRYQLQQVFFNIIANAEHAMQATGGGTLTVSSRLVGSLVKVSIKDTGPGMSPEVQSRIFEPFFTTKAVGEGTGLGLSICYGIVQDHGGEIGVRTKPGGGATFVIELPLRRAAEPLLRRGPASELPPSRTGSRILVVDDEEAILELVERTLSQDGFVVDTAMTGIEALKLLDKEVEKEFDLILTDVKMPGLDGPRLYAHLRENRPGLEKRIVFMTGDTSSAETQAFLESAKATYIGKPFELDALKDLVQRSLAELSTQSE